MSGKTQIDSKGNALVNIGAGKTFIPGYVNIDISSVADVVLDLNRERLPFKDNSVDIIFSYHALEHVENYLFALGEIHRVLRHGGWFLLGVPYVTLTEYNLVNPYHKQNFSEHSFDFFDERKLLGSAAEEGDILFKKAFHHYHYMGATNLMPGFIKNSMRRHLFNVVRKIDFGLIAVKEPDQTLAILDDQQYKMREKFLECCHARTPYGSVSPTVSSDKSSPRSRTRKFRKWWSGSDF
jgi:predicted SAM-dependent methyltransferase